MIYMKAGDQTVIILEPSNIKDITGGDGVRTPDKVIFIGYCPDIEWLAEEIKKIIGEDRTIDTERMDALLREGLKKFPVYRSDDGMKRIF